MAEYNKCVRLSLSFDDKERTAEMKQPFRSGKAVSGHAGRDMGRGLEIGRQLLLE
jgi:hypothetical protein